MKKTKWKVPRKKVATRFEVVWRYLEKVKEYDNLRSLHNQLVARFGADNTPSLTHLHRHIKQFRR